ncbi:MAG: Nif3-like dinuclear metal center hexameric protein [Chitinophagaceae bacterium]
MAEFVDVLDSIAPPSLAEPWDNVGLLVGDRAQPVRRALLTIDYTPAVAVEAKEKSCDVIVAYHPPIFEAVKRITASKPNDLLFDAIRRGIAIYSPHTALDVADGGTNDVLADVLSLSERRPLKLRDAKSTEFKLVTFVPENAVEKVSEALFAAGAGRIGNYSSCSFRSRGQGTFFGEAGTNPTVGQAGKLEIADEVRIETVVPIRSISTVVAALRTAHPYEEPAFDLQTLAAPPLAIGLGRVGRTPGDATAEMLVNLLKRALGVGSVLLAGDPQKLVRKVAVCAGACGGDLLKEAIAQNVDLYITGEMRHHDALLAVRAGLTVVCTLHSNSERITLPRYADLIRAKMSSVELLMSSVDADPFTIA